MSRTADETKQLVALLPPDLRDIGARLLCDPIPERSALALHKELGRDLCARLRMTQIYWIVSGMASLVEALGVKATMRPYIEPLGVSLPHRYCKVASVDEIDFAGLPSRYVVKPGNLANSEGVLLFDGNRELFSDKEVERKNQPDFIRMTPKGPVFGEVQFPC
jgi:hypothetical protein